MLKIAALLFNTIALFFYQLFFVDGVTITSKAPSSAHIGEEFTVEVTVEKGSIGGFAKLQQDLPAGFTAVEGQSGGATFTFTNQSVKLIWMSLPNDATIKISYKVKVAAEAVGAKTISGKFSYVTDNVKQSVDIPSSTITISEVGTAPPVAAAPVETPKPVEVNQGISQAAASINCSRKVPSNILSTNEFFVEIAVNKGNIGGFGKLVETLPEGFSAFAVDSKGGVFSFEDQKATFVWGAMPTQPEFKVSYKVKMTPTTDGEKVIEGVFSFVENDQTLKYVLPPGIIKVIGKPAPEPVAETPPKTEEPKVVSNDVISATTEEPKKAPEELSANSVPAPQRTGKVHYKVQILALRKAKDVEAVSLYFKMSETISLEMAEGFTKYTAGMHEEYKSARDAREKFRTVNGIAGPFVTAYNNGARITVQEALMITNQKWYN